MVSILQIEEKLGRSVAVGASASSSPQWRNPSRVSGSKQIGPIVDDFNELARGKARIFPLSGKMTADVGHIAAAGLLDSQVMVVVIFESRSDGSTDSGAQRVFDELNFYLPGRVRRVEDSDPHQFYRFISDGNRSGYPNVLSAGSATQIVERDDRLVSPLFHRKLEGSLRLHSTRLGD